MKTQIFYNGILILIGLVILGSCIKDEPDEPPFSTIPFDQNKVLTIGEVRNLYINNAGDYTFTEEYSVFGTVVADETSGNLYRSVFLQDHTGGIQLNFLYAGGLYEGDSIRIMLKGATVSNYNELYQITDLDQGKQIEKKATNNFITPAEVTINELKNNIGFYQSTLVMLKDVQMTDYFLDKTFADSANRQDENVYIRNCFWDSLIIRTSGYANFANKIVPQGRGNLLAIASVYNSDVQLVLRSYEEAMALETSRCAIGSGGTTIYFEDFNNGIGDWTLQNVQGAESWSFENSDGPDGSTCAKINGFNLGYHANEDWLISPVMDLLGYNAISFSFQSAMNFDGDALQVFIKEESDNDWTPLEVKLSKGSYNWRGSGFVNITSFDQQNIYLAFKYTSTNQDGSEWLIDNVEIRAE